MSFFLRITYFVFYNFYGLSGFFLILFGYDYGFVNINLDALLPKLKFVRLLLLLLVLKVELSHEL